MPLQELRRHCPGCFGDDLRRALYSATMQVALLILFERESLDDSSNAIDLVTNVQQPGARILARRHQKTRTASRSTSFRT